MLKRRRCEDNATNIHHTLFTNGHENKRSISMLTSPNHYWKPTVAPIFENKMTSKMHQKEKKLVTPS